MKTRISLLLCTFCLLTIKAQNCPNTLENDDSSVNVSFGNASWGSNTPGVFGVSNSNETNGSACALKLEQDGSGGSYNKWQMNIDLTASNLNAGDTVEFSIDGNGANGNARAIVGHGNTYLVDQTFNGNDWQTHSETFTVPNGVTSLYIWLYPNVGSAAAGSSLYDNLIVRNPNAPSTNLGSTAGNLALNKPASQSGTLTDNEVYYGAANVVDGNRDGDSNNLSTNHTKNTVNQWWKVDLGSSQSINRIDIYNRVHPETFVTNRLIGAEVYVGNSNSTNPSDFNLVGTLNGSTQVQSVAVDATSARYVMIRNSSDFLHIAEVEVYGPGSTGEGGSGESLWSQNGSNVSYTSGNVGIGTTSPESKLHISGGGQTIKLGTGSNSSGYSLNIGVNDDGINFSNNSGIRGYNFSNNTGTLMTIAQEGNVGIGTDDPDAPLAVNGRIHAQEVKVDTNFPAPDYVFYEDYDLKSLAEIQAYIDEHGHLPNIPSAKEIEANGIELGLMNMKLLEKIEELTLYILEQQELLQKQELRLGKLEAQIKD